MARARPPRRAPVGADDDEMPEDDRPPAPARRVPTPEEERGERRAGLRPGDHVRPIDGDELWRVRRVTADDTTGPIVVELEDGGERDASTLEPAAYGCPVCGLCAGPAVEHPDRRPCPDCLPRSPARARARLGRGGAERAADARTARHPDRRRARRPRPRRAGTRADPLERRGSPPSARGATRRAARRVRARLRGVGQQRALTAWRPGRFSQPGGACGWLAVIARPAGR